jgi:hypothetical protein
MVHKTFKAAIGFSTNETVVQFNYDEQAHTYTAQLVKQEEDDEILHNYVAMYTAHTADGLSTLEKVAEDFCLYFNVVHAKCDSTWFEAVL